MEQMGLRQYSKYFFIVFFIIILILSYLLVKPFVSAVLTSVFLAYVFYPIYAKLNSKLKKKNLSSFLMVILIILLIFIPLLFSINAIVREVINIYGTNINYDIIPDKLVNYFEKINLKTYINNLVDQFISYITKNIPNLFLFLPNKLLDFVISIFIMFFLFRDGKEIIEWFEDLIPLSKDQKKKFIDKFDNMSSAVVYGYLLTAFIQGLVAGVGFWLLGIPSPLLWGILTMIFGLIPFVGAVVVWLPLGLYQLLLGNVFTGVSILLFGALVISLIDNFLKPKLISKKTDIHPIVILLGVIGGLKVFGFIGLFIGPIILSMLIVFLELYKGERL
ncbi:hypothetical protein CL618_02020 [archaeon]|nr:hypothetical protein [archaeon]|tara:strand:+ start:1160 stop:2158 length:999 start_codon:yes stop_codon:yes gene_type:complete